MLDNADQVKEVMNEVKAMRKLEHTNLVTFVGACLCPYGNTHKLYLVMELVNGQDIQKRLQSPSPFAPDMVYKIGLQLARGLQYMHSIGIVHRDLKPANVLLYGGDRIKITDFGVCRMRNAATAASVNVTQLMSVGVAGLAGTPLYMAPELTVATGKVDLVRCDVYSFGMLMFEIATGLTPFGDSKFATVEQLYVVVRAGGRPKFPEACPMPEVFKALIKECWDAEPACRPKFDELVQHFSGWTTLPS